MSVYGFNEKLEKVPIVRLSKTLSCAATIDTYSDKVSASYYSIDASAQTVTMRVTLMKVA